MAARKSTRRTLTSRRAEAGSVQIVRTEPLRTLLEWRAPIRTFKKRSREYFTTLGSIAFLLIVILLLIKQWMLIVVIIALMFVAYIMVTVPPGEVEHKITNRGIKIGQRTYRWQELGRFWFNERGNQGILSVETLVPFPQRLMLLLGKTKQEEIEKVLSDYLPLEEPEKTWVDKASEWISRWVPLEKID